MPASYSEYYGSPGLVHLRYALYTVLPTRRCQHAARRLVRCARRSISVWALTWKRPQQRRSNLLGSMCCRCCAAHTRSAASWTSHNAVVCRCLARYAQRIVRRAPRPGALPARISALVVFARIRILARNALSAVAIPAVFVCGTGVWRHDARSRYARALPLARARQL